MNEMLQRYQNAEKLLVQNTKNAVLNGRLKITWIDQNSFYYGHEARSEAGIEITYLLVDCRSGKKKPLFDHQELKDRLKNEGLSDHLCFEQMEIKGTQITFILDQKQYSYDFADQTWNSWGYVQQEESLSSDFYRVFVKDYNLYAECLKDHHIRQLTFDGEPENSYASYAEYSEAVKRRRNQEPCLPGILFSHDGKKILTYRLDQRKVRSLFVLQSFDEEGRESIRPQLYTYKCPFPEDQDVPLAYLYLIDLVSGKITPVQCDPFYTGYGLFTEHSKIAYWMDDDRDLVATWLSRGSKTARLFLINAQNGHCRCLVEESTSTFLNLGTHGELDGFGEYAFSNFVTQDRKWAVWQSERDDLARYFLYDVETGRCQGAITPDTILASSMIRWDEQQHLLYFIGTHLSHTSDPVYECLCSVSLNGQNFRCLTEEDAFHEISMGERYFVDTYSRVDLPPTTLLRDHKGKLITILEKADISALLALGYQIPERFTVKASDGKTDLYGILIRPVFAQNEEKVPVIDHLYGGMQCYFVPKQFTWDHPQNREIFGGLQSLAQLGFAGIMLDGLGTPGRGKKLHDLSYQNIHGCAGLKDHVYAAKELQEKYPFLDFERIGLWGNSGGGCATSRGMLEYPDFYQVGVSSAGNHDQRMYNNGWTERYYGLYDREIYLLGDNTALAQNLKGKLLIVHGAMDDNVAFSQSLRLVDALIRADKDFDLLILPRADHNIPADLYFVRRKMDYFVQHLLKKDPPKDFHFTLKEINNEKN